MWVIFDKIQYRDDLVGKESGKTYSGWEATGTKKGYQGTPDEDWTKVFFDNQTTTVIENGLPNHNQSIVQFFQKACKQGDRLSIKMERDGRFWRIVSIENRNSEAPTYTPLSEQTIQSAQVPTVSPSELPWNNPTS